MDAERLVLAIDQGTTSSRAMLFDRAGRPQASAQQEFPQHFPQPGWVEHDPEDIWRDTLAVAKGALEQADGGADGVAAIGITNQRETTVIWDRASGQPIHHAIVWQDRRTAPFLRANCGGRGSSRRRCILERTGLVTRPLLLGHEDLHWLLEQRQPDARSRAERGELAFGTVDSWLIWQLTGGAVARRRTSATPARTMLFDIHAQGLVRARSSWNGFDIPAAILLPRVTRQQRGAGSSCATRGDLGAPAAADHGHGRRPAGGDLRPGLSLRRAWPRTTYGTGCFLPC